MTERSVSASTAAPLRVCVLGAAGDTGNLGVNALMESTLAGLSGAGPTPDITVFDNGLGRQRTGTLHLDGDSVVYRRVGLRLSRRLYLPEALGHVRLAARTGLPNPAVRALRRADVALDISGGDSFTDLYGPRRFELMAGQKDLVLQSNTPLVLLPQTYGPFASPGSRAEAARLVRGSRMAWARDEDSYAALSELLGSDLDPHRHRQGVDVAFALPRVDPTDGGLEAWKSGPTLGLNISGLLYNDPTSAGAFGLSGNYRTLMQHLLDSVLDETDAQVLLVPHVIPSGEVVESDIVASARLAADRDPQRVRVASGYATAPEVKGVIAGCDAFCGTRMHSTIAALSTCTPVVALAYSLKTRGVFASCGQAGRVVELRTASEDEIIAGVLDLWRDRQAAKAELVQAVPGVVAAARAPFDPDVLLAECEG